MRYIIVTGAAGMIGSGVVRHLNDIGKTNLILVDDLKKTEKWKNLVGKQFVDILSKHKLFDWLVGRENEVEAIIHLGACSDTVETDCDYLLENNFRYTTRLAEWALKANKRFIYASSAATYGDGACGFSDEALEELRPLNMYGYSKHLADLWMKREGVLNKVVALKYFNVFGPNEYHKGRMASMVLKMTDKARKDGHIELFKSNHPNFGDGDQCRDFIYVKDAVKMTCSFLTNTAGGIFNIGKGVATTWNQLANALFHGLQQEPIINYVAMPPDLARQYQNYTCATMSKYNALFPSETYSIDHSVKEYVQDYLLTNSRW